MKMLGRFITRPANKNQPDLILGGFMKEQDFFKPGKVYELREIMGTVQIVEVGDCVVANCPKQKDDIPDVPSWGNSVENILLTLGNKFLLTKKEYQNTPSD
jgi:hypothetical protein